MFPAGYTNRFPRDQVRLPRGRVAVREPANYRCARFYLSNICKDDERRFKDAGPPARVSAHSFRVSSARGHADPRPTRLFYQRDERVARNIMERDFDSR
jgi:hypothetical protein